MKPWDAFVKTYHLPGGARAFWLMVAGCVGAIVLPIIFRDNSTLSMIILFVPALIAIVFGQQFTATFSQMMVENSKPAAKPHKKKRK